MRRSNPNQLRHFVIGSKGVGTLDNAHERSKAKAGDRFTFVHLPENPYTVPEFTEEHAWIMDPNSRYWDPEKK